MIARISRYLLILLVIFIASIFLPDLYWLSFGEPTKVPFIAYSPVTDDFIIGKMKDRKFVWTDRQDNEFSMTVADSLLPLSNYRQLAAKGKLPDSVKGIKIDLDEIRLNNFRQRIRPRDIEPPAIPLYMLFESNPPRLELELPKSFFRITNRMEFIDAETNTIVDSLTNSFTAALKKKNFSFPARMIAGNPTTRKPFDEGYFVVDSKGKMFHVKMIDGKPFVRDTKNPQDIDIREIFISERNLKEFYGVIISRTNEIYFILYDQYRLQKLPTENYNADEHTLMIQGNLLYRMIHVRSDNQVNTFVTDRNYKLLASHQENWSSRYDLPAGKMIDYIFPFTLKLQSAKNLFVNYYHLGYSFAALYANLILMLIFFVFTRKSRQKLSIKIIDSILILFTGVYGLLATLLIPDTD